MIVNHIPKFLELEEKATATTTTGHNKTFSGLPAARNSDVKIPAFMGHSTAWSSLPHTASVVCDEFWIRLFIVFWTGFVDFLSDMTFVMSMCPTPTTNELERKSQ